MKGSSAQLPKSQQMFSVKDQKSNYFRLCGAIWSVATAHLYHCNKKAVIDNNKTNEHNKTFVIKWAVGRTLSAGGSLPHLIEMLSLHS